MEGWIYFFLGALVVSVIFFMASRGPKNERRRFLKNAFLIAASDHALNHNVPVQQWILDNLFPYEFAVRTIYLQRYHDRNFPAYSAELQTALQEIAPHAKGEIGSFIRSLNERYAAGGIMF